MMNSGIPLKRKFSRRREVPRQLRIHIPRIAMATTAGTPASSSKRPSKAQRAAQSNGSPESIFAEELLKALTAFRSGDFSTRLQSNWTGLDGKIADIFNDVLEMSERRAREAARVCNVVGKEGRLRQRMSTTGMSGGWADEIDALNTLMDDLVRPTTEVARTIGAVAKGDLGQSMAESVDGRPLDGEFLHTAKLVNRMIDQLTVFTSEVTRVSREVGIEGKLGGQAQVKGVSGVWKDLTESVNQMAGNLTAQVRNIADVTIAVANGDLSKKNHRRRAWRDSPAQGSDQHDGRSAAFLRVRSHSCGPRGRHRGSPWRSGRRARRRGHVERSHGLGQRHGVQSYGASA